MKAIAIGVAFAATGLGMAIASHANLEYTRSGGDFPAGCIVSVAPAPGYLPRAGLHVQNRRGHAIRAWLEAREGSNLKRVELATISALGRKTFAHVLPAGRNVLVAEDMAGARDRQVILVKNRGAETCGRRYIWRIE